METYAAGILFKSAGKVFLVKRGDDGSWAVPGGKLEEGETPEAAARREVLEECGVDYAAPLTPHALIDGYVTYIAEGGEQFEAVLNEENQAYGWFSLDELPEPLHPGMVSMLEAEPLNEMDVAGLISGGQLTSPQFFRNMYLWALRITGTGVTWRSKFRQYAYRSPENYLTDEFLARCAGLPVIWWHPEKNVLNSEEFAARTIGAIAFAWIQGDEVWGMARIYDTDAAVNLSTRQLSTSPTVTGGDDVLINVDGEPLLLEGNPVLLDHLAICEQGVWDKLGDPAGVKSDTLNEVQKMDEEKVLALINQALDARDSRAKADAEEKAKADAEAEEKAKADAAEAEEKAKADAAEAEEKAKADAAEAEEKAKADSELAKIRADMEELKNRVPQEISDEERNEIADTQCKADSVFASFGERAPQPMAGERVMPYRRRIMTRLQKYSADYKEVDLHTIADSQLLSIAEKKIYADAQASAASSLEPGSGLREVVRTDATGRRISNFIGEPSACWAPFQAVSRKLSGINQ
ncbi:TPA: NUDIX hydrolase [Serratia marcescens]|uniref:NUDIX hydrolase n=2 Tax=Serratia nevei TaxID=2703794 RepID=A0AAW6WZ06_9GAMM|nr:MULTISPECIES: NUDIX hydrolase [Serratia]MDK4764229.1 NUDIX hydrolase [Serratia nevei]MDK4771699.1 NUDIX hydrolase [Serratia nevei]MDK4794173.1 NUDIX hydrolase [Serratia nevei]MDK4856473.1 NUDIX hydrolase [Serratia nevei]MDK4936324.1 NUDIX hydrolase [Serratia nevei]